MTSSAPHFDRSSINATGIGLAGIEGVWWLPAVQPFQLPSDSHHQLQRIANAIFALFDAVNELHGTPEGEACGLNRLLCHKVPPHLAKWASKKPVLAVRPDFQLVARKTSGVFPRTGALTSNEIKTPAVLPYDLVATELEICPSAQGFAHAMQIGYGLEPDLVNAYAQFLAGRELLIVCTQAWSEFIWDQLAFCAALHKAGAKARLLLDIPIEKLAQQVRQKQRWAPPLFGIPKLPEIWNDDVLGRIGKCDAVVEYVATASAIVPPSSVVFRFGYLDCFAAEILQQLSDWEDQGATVLNPTSFVWDSKVVMAAARIPKVREQIGDGEVLAELDRCIPETRLLTVALLPQLQRERQYWVLKFAGFDSGQQAWGGRSLQLGVQHDDDSWNQILQHYLKLPFPVVAQRAMPSARLNIAYFDLHGATQWMRDGNTRLRSFFLRDGNAVHSRGSHLTVSGGATQVSESVSSVQAPVAALQMKIG
jgi:hypothetical protein